MTNEQAAVISQGRDGPCYRVQTSSFDVIFTVGSGEELDAVDNVDAEVRLPDGSRWSATIFTMAAVERLMARWAHTGENAGGRYFACSDGLVVREPGVGKMTDVLAALHQEDVLRAVLRRLDGPGH